MSVGNPMRSWRKAWQLQLPYCALCDLYGVEMPICNAVDAVVNRGEDPDQVLLDLFMRSLKKEF